MSRSTSSSSMSFASVERIAADAAGVMACAIAQKASIGVLVVDEFQTSKTTPAKLAKNAADLNAFVSRITQGRVPALEGALAGPFWVPGKPLLEESVELFLVKEVRVVSSAP